MFMEYAKLRPHPSLRDWGQNYSLTPWKGNLPQKCITRHLAPTCHKDTDKGEETPLLHQCHKVFIIKNCMKLKAPDSAQKYC